MYWLARNYDLRCNSNWNNFYADNTKFNVCSLSKNWWLAQRCASLYIVHGGSNGLRRAVSPASTRFHALLHASTVSLPQPSRILPDSRSVEIVLSLNTVAVYELWLRISEIDEIRIPVLIGLHSFSNFSCTKRRSIFYNLLCIKVKYAFVKPQFFSTTTHCHPLAVVLVDSPW